MTEWSLSVLTGTLHNNLASDAPTFIAAANCLLVFEDIARLQLVL